MNDEIIDLDNSWIEEFEKTDNQYKNYYTEDISFIRVHSIYVDKNNSIIKIKEQKVLLKTPGLLDRDELLTVIKNNSFFFNIKYSLLSILKFNIDIEPVNLTNFLKNKDANIGSSFLYSNKHINTINFNKSISMFHDINNIIIIFNQKMMVSKDRNYTKKIFINSNTKKKTKKKELKDIPTL
jgi:hypothetical protein